MKDEEDRYPVREARQAFSDLVNRVHYTGEPVGITKHGRLVARVVPASEDTTEKSE